MSAAVTVLMENGALADNIDHLRRTYARRMAALSDAIRRSRPDADFTTPAGGYFLWLPLPEGVPEHANVAVLPGHSCSLSGGWHDHARLSVSLHDEAGLVDGVQRLFGSI